MATKKIQWQPWNAATQSYDLLHPETECAQIVDLAAQLATKVDKSSFGSWVTMSLYGGATGTAKYRLDTMPDGSVRTSIKIALSSGNTLASDTAFATLPSGARPPADIIFVGNMSGADPVSLLVSSVNGTLMVQTRFGSGNTWAAGNYMNVQATYFVGA